MPRSALASACSLHAACLLLTACFAEALPPEDGAETTVDASSGATTDATSSGAATSSAASSEGSGSGDASTSGDASEDDSSSEDGSTGAPACTLAASWELVDEFSGVASGGIDGAAAQGRGIAGDALGNLLAVGNANGRWIVRRSEDRGGSWTTVDDFVLSEAGESGASAVAVAPDGTFYVAGAGVDAGGQIQRVVRRSSDAGDGWETVDAFHYQDGLATYASSIAVAPDGSVWNAGQAASSQGARWVLRSSADGTGWSTASDFQLVEGQLCIPFGLASDDAGVIYASGHCNDAMLVSHWIVRRRALDGTWTTVDAQVGEGEMASGSAVGTTARGRVLVAGTLTADGIGRWTVRASDDGRAWSTIDDHGEPGLTVAARGIHDHRDGTLVAIGTLVDATPHMRTRRSDDDGATWQTIDDFGYEAGIYAGALGTDAEGDLFTAGIGLASDGTNRWLVRRMRCD